MSSLFDPVAQIAF